MTRPTVTHLFTPAEADRRQRREQKRQQDLAGRRTSGPGPSQRPRTPVPDPDLAPAYPRGGRPGPTSGRAGTLHLPAHRMTTAIASGAYPFLAEGGLGADGVYIGRDVHAESSFAFDPFRLYSSMEGFTNPNVLLAGVIGTGKSALAKSIALRSIAFGYRIYIPCDPKGEWSAVAHALGGDTIALGPGLGGRLNPLDAPARPAGVGATEWSAEIHKRRLLLLGSLARTVLARDLRPMEHTALDIALGIATARAAAADRTPLIGDIDRTLNTPTELNTHATGISGNLGEAARDLAHALRRLIHGDLAGMFDAPSTTVFNPRTPMLSIDLSRMGNAGDDTALVLAMTCASAWMESALADPTGGRRWVIYDEAWRLMRHIALLERMQSHWKLSCGLGIANMMVIHRLSDLLTAGDAGSRGRALAEGLLADCSTRIVYRQETDQLTTAAGLLGLTTTETHAVGALSKGRGLWKVGPRSFIAQHLLHAHEAELFDTDTRMTSNRPRTKGH
ncbi:ATP-binding protein [Streptomyces carpaticus]|uniref:ATP-binding protein n=1 Tax=Streptomyces carpaticus TaxID=285558 RepID=UPI00220FEEFD|nr:ATP-binding protein [Streptomyces carpaticus]